MANTQTPLEHTRQMLDELEVLMERMMALPVNEPESQPAFDASMHVPTVSATVTLLDVPSTGEAGATADQMNVGLETRIAVPELTAPKSTAADTALGLLPDELMPASVMAMATPPVEARPMPPWKLTSVCLQPLYWTNRGFDRCTTLLGPGGQWLRRPIGRHILGIMGLAFLGLALGWIIKDWLGWNW